MVRAFSGCADVAVTGARDRPVPAGVGSAIYRIAQEALTNVAKHADASHVSVIVEQPRGRSAADRRRRWPWLQRRRTVERAKTEHWLGLAGMHERAALVGGRVTVESTRGRGTTLFARVPLDRSPGDLTE